MKRNLNRELGLAFEQEDAESVQRLITLGADINASGKWSGDCTMLWLTVHAAGQEISKDFKNLAVELADYLPSVPQRNHAAQRDRFLRILRTLIAAGVEVNKPSHGSTLLRIAVKWQDLEVVKLLLANGANPNAESFSVLSTRARKTKPGYYNTALHEAVEKGSPPIVQVLLNAGADTQRQDHEGKTPIELARKMKRAEIAEVLGNSS